MNNDMEKLKGAIENALDIWHEIHSPEGAPIPTRELALVRTKLQEASFWLQEGIDNTPEN